MAILLSYISLILYPLASACNLDICTVNYCYDDNDIISFLYTVIDINIQFVCSSTYLRLTWLFIFRYTLSYTVALIIPFVCLSTDKVNVYSDMPKDRDERIRSCTFCLSYFSFILARSLSQMSRKSYAKRISFVLQEIDRAIGSKMMDYYIPN